MKTYLEKIHESELYALDQTIKVWKKILGKKEALIMDEASLGTLKFIFVYSATIRSSCFLCEHYGTCEDCILKGCYTGEGIYKNIQKSIDRADGVMLELWIERLISKCYARIRELTEIYRVDLYLKFDKEVLDNEKTALITAIYMHLYLQYHPEIMLQYSALDKAKRALFAFTKEWIAMCPLCEYHEYWCEACPLTSCRDDSVYEQLWTAYEEHDLHEFEFGCATIVRLCYNRLEELEEENA